MEEELHSKFNGCSTCQQIKSGCLEENSYSLSSDSESEQETSTNYSETSITDEDKYSSESFEEDDENDEIDEDIIDMNFSLDSLQTNVIQRRSQVNKTFNSEKLRDIERNNGILMSKILSYNRRVNQYKIAPKTTELKNVPSAAINRRKNQQKIAYDNQILLKKIQSVKPSVKHK